MKYLISILIATCILARGNAAAVERAAESLEPTPTTQPSNDKDYSTAVQDFLQELASKEYNELKPEERTIGLLLPILFPNSFTFGG